MAVLKQQEMGLNKSSVTFTGASLPRPKWCSPTARTAKLPIALDGPVVRGLKARLDKATVPGHGTAVLSLQYDPSDKSGAKDVWEPKGTIGFRIFASPFDRIFPVSVQFIGK